MNRILKWTFKFSAQHWERTLNSQRVTKVSTHSFVHISIYTVGIHKLTSKTNVKNLLQNKLYAYGPHRNIGLLSSYLQQYRHTDISNRNCTVVNIIRVLFSKILLTPSKQSSRYSMKLHIAIMPQRGLFWGFGTQGPHWKKIKILRAYMFPFCTCLRFILRNVIEGGQDV